LHDDSVFIASEKIAFEKYTDQCILMNEGEIIEIDLNNRHEFFKNHKTRIQTITDRNLNPTAKHLPKYSSFFEQEIFE